MLSRNSKRKHAAYARSMARAYEEFCTAQEALMEDYLDALYQRYPFRHSQDSRESLANVVMKQLRYVLYKLKDTKHIIWAQMEDNKIDWLAEPYFRGQQLRLSQLTAEYDYYHRYPTYSPSSACHEMFWVNVQEPAAYEDTDAHEQREDWRSPLDETETKRARTAE